MGTQGFTMNALRLLRCPTMASSRGLCSAVPRASDKWVNVTFINQSNGERWPTVGLEGQSLLALAKANQIGLRGGTARASHVHIAREFEEIVPLSEESEAELCDAVSPHDLTSGSRLANEIVLTAAMNGMNVAVPLPEGPPEFP